MPLICYEIIFPGEAVPKGERPGWLLNVTNDAWFGISSGPYQHFQQARVRAIEEGLPLVRAANNGISAVVDPFGRIVGSLPLGQEGVLDSALPRPIAATIYARIGDLLFFIVVGATIFASCRRSLAQIALKVKYAIKLRCRRGSSKLNCPKNAIEFTNFETKFACSHSF